MRRLDEYEVIRLAHDIDNGITSVRDKTEAAVLVDLRNLLEGVLSINAEHPLSEEALDLLPQEWVTW